MWGAVGWACISLSELLGLRKTLKRVEKILRVVVTVVRSSGENCVMVK